MYEQQSHYLLNSILDQLKPEIRARPAPFLYPPGRQFLRYPQPVQRLYGQREDFEAQLLRLVSVMASQYIARRRGA